MKDVADRSWRDLCRDLHTNDAVFVLGAGISRRSGFPTWATLVERLARSARLKDTDWKALRALQRQGMAWPTILGLIEKRHGKRGSSRRAWQEALRTALYQGFREWLGAEDFDRLADCEKSKQPDAGLAARIRRKNKVLAQIVDLCATREDDGTWSPSRHIGAVLTYNFDGLVQMYDRVRHGSPRIFRTIERASKPQYRNRVQKARGKIPLYHLHGYLSATSASSRKEAADSMILSEDEYHRRTDEPFNFSNAALLSRLQAAVCVFVGCSMTDELMRRSLFRSKVELQAALRAEEGNEPRDTELLRHYAVSARSDAREGRELDARECWIAESLHVLGTRPLWVRNDYKDLPSRLESLRAFVC